MENLEAKKQLRQLLSRLQLEKGSELLCFPQRKPKIKKLDGWAELDVPPLEPGDLDTRTGIVIHPDQWRFAPYESRRHGKCHLVVLGVGQFKVSAVAYANVLSLCITAEEPTSPPRPPTDSCNVPFVPKRNPPSLSAEATVEI